MTGLKGQQDGREDYRRGKIERRLQETCSGRINEENVNRKAKESGEQKVMKRDRKIRKMKEEGREQKGKEEEWKEGVTGAEGKEVKSEKKNELERKREIET